MSLGIAEDYKLSFAFVSHFNRNIHTKFFSQWQHIFYFLLLSKQKWIILTTHFVTCSIHPLQESLKIFGHFHPFIVWGGVKLLLLSNSGHLLVSFLWNFLLIYRKLFFKPSTWFEVKASLEVVIFTIALFYKFWPIGSSCFHSERAWSDWTRQQI